ncbi:MAG: hypothetical protein IJ061_00490, partial [Lachnospiraceae bacterium]|nr:hypothetical protein [Lachnospiraceae bacterium]
MKKHIALLLGMCMLMLAGCKSAPAPAAETTAAAAETTASETAAAQQEETTAAEAEEADDADDAESVSGELVIYTSMYPFVIDMMDEAIKAKFPNLEPGNDGSFFFYAGTSKLITKIYGEMGDNHDQHLDR